MINSHKLGYSKSSLMVNNLFLTIDVPLPNFDISSASPQSKLTTDAKHIHVDQTSSTQDGLTGADSGKAVDF